MAIRDVRINLEVSGIQEIQQLKEDFLLIARNAGLSEEQIKDVSKELTNQARAGAQVRKEQEAQLKTVQQLERELKKLNASLRVSTDPADQKRLTAEIGRTEAAIKQATVASKRFEAESARSTRGIRANFSGIADGILSVFGGNLLTGGVEAVASSIVNTFTSSVSAATSFETALADLSAITGAVGADL